MEKLIVLLIILFSLYILILFMIGLDFWSGIRKAKKNNKIKNNDLLKKNTKHRGFWF